MGNKIWIELEKPTSLEHAQKQCELANNALRRLVGGELASWFSTYANKRAGNKPRYFYGNNGGDFELSDNGHWFNLDYLGRPIEDGPVSQIETAARLVVERWDGGDLAEAVRELAVALGD